MFYVLTEGWISAGSYRSWWGYPLQAANTIAAHHQMKAATINGPP